MCYRGIPQQLRFQQLGQEDQNVIVKVYADVRTSSHDFTVNFSAQPLNQRTDLPEHFLTAIGVICVSQCQQPWHTACCGHTPMLTAHNVQLSS